MAIVSSRWVNMCHEEMPMQGSLRAVLQSEWCPKMEWARLKRGPTSPTRG